MSTCRDDYSIHLSPSHLLFCEATAEVVRVGPPDVPRAREGCTQWRWGRGGEERRRRRRRRFGEEQPGTESLLAGRTPPSSARQRSKHLPDVTKEQPSVWNLDASRREHFPWRELKKKTEGKVWDAVFFCFWLFPPRPGGGGTWSLFIVAGDEPRIKGRSGRGAGSLRRGVCSELRWFGGTGRF